MTAQRPPLPTQPGPDADSTRFAALGYRQELSRVLGRSANLSVAFTYLSPMVGIYSLFVLGVGSGGPRYPWLMPIVVIGVLFVALVSGELGSHYPVAGALYQYSTYTVGPNYGWWVGWFCGIALLGTFGIAVLLAFVGFHHDLGFLFSMQGAERLSTNPLEVGFGGNWLTGAALVAILAHVYIIYGFESAGDVAEETKDATRTPTASHAQCVAGRRTDLLRTRRRPAPGDLCVLLLRIVRAGAGARLAFSYARDGAVPGSRILSHVSRRFHTPVYALLLGAQSPTRPRCLP